MADLGLRSRCRKSACADGFAMRSVEEAVRLAQNGDVAAFTDLIARFERTALAVAFGVLADSDRSGDTVQEAFVRAWQRLGDLREPERFGA
jgi:DNA-directed RNA polymerase specialized sigma24 family protein